LNVLLDQPGRQYRKNRGLLEEFYLLGYNAVWYVESKPTFWRNISPSSSGSKNKTSKKPDTRALLATRFQAGLLLGLFLGPADGCDMLFRNAC
jgi:hypothetical protein